MEEILHIVFIVFALFCSADAQSCPSSYYHCTGYDWCCSNGYVCTGSSTCVSIAAIVGACIGGLIGIAILITCICACCVQANKRSRSVGTVIQQNPGTGTTAVSSQQGYGMQPQYGQASAYGQKPEGNPAHPPDY